MMNFDDSYKCQNCSGHIFVADIDTQIIWAHLEDTGCDDPGLTLEDYIYFECHRQKVTNYGDFAKAWDRMSHTDISIRDAERFRWAVQLLAAVVEPQKNKINPYSSGWLEPGYSNLRTSHVGFMHGGSAAPVNEVRERFDRWCEQVFYALIGKFDEEDAHRYNPGFCGKCGGDCYFGTDVTLIDALIRQLLQIHPWVDANGRTASILRNWMLNQLENPEPLPYYDFGNS